jgi:chaperone required for assembly of F1-ATPase
MNQIAVMEKKNLTKGRRSSIIALTLQLKKINFLETKAAAFTLQHQFQLKQLGKTKESIHKKKNANAKNLKMIMKNVVVVVVQN